MTGYLWRGLVRHLRQSRTLLGLTVLGVALGVASVVAIQTLNQGSLHAFDGSVRAISGQADLTVTGVLPFLDEQLLLPVLGDADVDGAWPLIRANVAVSGHPDLNLDVVGFDIFAPVRYPLQDAAAAQDDPNAKDDPNRRLGEALAVPGWVAVTPELATSEGWAVGDSVMVSSGSRAVRLVIGALVDFRRFEPLAPRRLAVMDIAQAQELFGRPGKIQQVDIVLRKGADPAAVAARLQERLGAGVRVQTPEQRRQDASGLLAAFRLNLTALSLISVFVGVFLVLTTVQASLVRRRREFGVLRSLGATRAQVLWLVLGESAALGVLGTALGIPLGWLAARHNLQTVSATLTSIYVTEGIDKLVLPPTVIALGAAVGLLGALGGTLLPAWDLARRDPLRLLSPLVLHEGAGRGAGRLALLAAALAAAGTLWFAAWGHSLRMGGFVYGFVMMLALPPLVPLVVRTICAGARPSRFGLALSLRNLLARLQTTSFAVAALAVTVSMMFGITILVGSFRETLVTWLDVTIRADIYISSESWQRTGNDAFLEDDVLATLRDWPGVVSLEEQRRLRVGTVGGRPVWLNGLRMTDRPLPGVPQADMAGRLPLLAGTPQAAVAGLRAGGVLIGEPLSRKDGLTVGDTLRLAGPRGAVALPICGVTYDYTSEGGTAFVSMDVLGERFDAAPPNNAAVFLAPGSDVEGTVDALQRTFADRPLVIRSNRTLRGEVLAIFDQTFAVTRTLQGMALLIAALGVSVTLLIQAHERAGELALLRALGATRRQVFGLFLGEGAAMGALGLLLGLFGGLGLAALLILVINRTWFGWTIRPAWPGQELAVQALVVMAVAALAAMYPASRARLAQPGQLTRDDL
ncbi:MAG: FtsX-like permease family protein [bacterium]|nr:FtsX-like permease family protein [bacterium]